MSRCSIRITHLKKQSEPDIKGITFEITDNEVLSLTNGIVQGMSGSPIIRKQQTDWVCNPCGYEQCSSRLWLIY